MSHRTTKGHNIVSTLYRLSTVYHEGETNEDMNTSLFRRSSSERIPDQVVCCYLGNPEPDCFAHIYYEHLPWGRWPASYMAYKASVSIKDLLNDKQLLLFLSSCMPSFNHEIIAPCDCTQCHGSNIAAQQIARSAGKMLYIKNKSIGSALAA